MISVVPIPARSTFHGGVGVAVAGDGYRYGDEYAYGYDQYGYRYVYNIGVHGCRSGGCGTGASLISNDGKYFRARDQPPSVRRESIGFMMVSWNKPKPGCFKLNTDGASKGNPGPSSCGGIIRDCEGKWVSGFHRTMGFGSSITAELWALRDGLKLAMCLGLWGSKLEVEVDAMQILKLIDDTDGDHGQLQRVVLECRCLLEQFGLTTPKHVYREANQCADILANFHVADDSTTQDGLTVFQSAPSCVESRMLADASGALCRRILYK